MRSFLLLAGVSLLALWLGSSVVKAEKIPLFLPGRYMMLDNYSPTPPIVASNASSIFILAKGVLAKYNAVNHQQEGLLELFGTPTAPPANWLFDDMAAGNNFRNERAKRLLPASMQVTDTEIQIIIGDQYIRVDPATLKIDLNITLEAEGIRQNSIDQYVYTMKPHPLVIGDKMSYRVLIPAWPNQDDPIFLEAFEPATGEIINTGVLLAEMQGRPEWIQVPTGDFFKQIHLIVQLLPITLVPTDGYLFIFRQGILAKVDGETLKVSKSISLYGPKATLADPANATIDEKMVVNIDLAKRCMPAMLQLNDKTLNILIGDDYFSIDTTDLTIKTKGQLVKTDEAEMRDHIDELCLRGLPPLAGIGNTLYTIDGTNLIKIDCNKGAVTTKELPALLVRTLLPDAKNGGLTNHITPKNGENIMLTGLLEKHVEPQDTYWTLLDQNYGEILLGGDKFNDLLAKIDNPSFSIANAFGAYKTDGVDSILEVQFIGKVPAISLNGTLTRQTKDAQTIWTLKTNEGTEYTLVGNILTELTKHPKYQDKSITVMGSLLKDYKDLPLIGKAYLQSDRVVLPESPAALPLAMTATSTDLVITRAGVISVFDPSTLEEKASADLFPPMPELTKDNGQAYNQERIKRITAPKLIVNGKDIFVLIGNNLFNSSLDLKQVKSANVSGISTLTDNYCCFVNNDIMTVVSTNDVAQKYDITLPKEMLARLFPTMQELHNIK